MVGPAGDTKLSAFWSMCFSKPPHFGNRGTVPDNEFFKINMNNIKNTWKGIRNLISWKQSASPYIHLLSQDNETVSNPRKTANIFTVAEKTKAKVRFSHKSFDEFLQHPNENSFFLRPTSLDEITNLILLLNESKSVGPNGLPTKILKLLKNDIS